MEQAKQGLLVEMLAHFLLFHVNLRVQFGSPLTVYEPASAPS